MKSSNHVAPILVLGLGDLHHRDDGLGPGLLADLARRYGSSSAVVEFVDGGTQGMALLGRLAGRQALVVLDAVSVGHEPGCVSLLEGSDVIRFATSRCASAREGNAGELLATLAFLGELPDKCYIISVEPRELGSGTGLSDDVQKSLKAARKQAQQVLEGLLEEAGALVGA